MAILHMDQGAELILKAYLLRSGFIINKVSQKKVRQGIRSGIQIDDYLDTNKTLDFEEARQQCMKLMRSHTGQQMGSSSLLAGLEKLHKKRNQIQHYGVRVFGKTPELIFNALQDLLTIYKLAEFRAEHFSARAHSSQSDDNGHEPGTFKT